VQGRPLKVRRHLQVAKALRQPRLPSPLNRPARRLRLRPLRRSRSKSLNPSWSRHSPCPTIRHPCLRISLSRGRGAKDAPELPQPSRLPGRRWRVARRAKRNRPLLSCAKWRLHRWPDTGWGSCGREVCAEQKGLQSGRYLRRCLRHRCSGLHAAVVRPRTRRRNACGRPTGDAANP